MKKINGADTATTAPAALRILWRDKFFLKSKSQKNVEDELHKRGYNFGDATRKALESASFLLRQGGRGTRTYIQKYNFIDEMEDGKKQ